MRPRTSLLNPASANVRDRDSLPAAPSPLSRLAYVPPSVAVQAYARTPTTPLTTFGPPSPLLTASFPPSISGGSGMSTSSGIPPPAPLSPHLPTSEMDEAFGMGMPPPTPAYPAYGPSSPVPPTPRAQGPLAGWGGNVGPTVDIPRSRMPGTPGMGSGSGSSGSAGLGSAGLGTSGPLVGGEEVEPDGEVGGEEGKKVVVSVGLLPPPQLSAQKGLAVVGQPRIYPHDQFTLDIFVFNQSAWTRRFEVSCPERRRRRQQQGKGERVRGPGFVPLENRVRVGPLRPATCQSVRMDFLALTPGLHTIDTLTLTDVETGFSMNLRSVMDIVVHETHER
ncbi:hypothetical protein EVG20_g9138 [Dentipellis fragilis]|uniref:Trafficking protein particle complex II-specific subunit 65 IgD3 domain-containing protein n=1 Tax=Dentipellis fragilis TaxID=205917 RepID=A0A4Y9Y2U9_9AGAM|nr:hypothetical protein EVG20_g9138 [Dentipellis fragilis]